MAMNPMQRKANSSFLMGMLLTLLVCGAIIAFLFMQLTKLNEEQLKAVKYNDGPLLIIAGAGSGKTRVLTVKIAYLIENNIFLNICYWF